MVTCTVLTAKVAVTDLAESMVTVQVLPEQPATFRTVAFWVGIMEYVLAALTGNPPLTVDRSIASATGLYELSTGDWDPSALELAGITADQLARIVEPTDQVGVTSAETAIAARPFTSNVLG